MDTKQFLSYFPDFCIQTFDDNNLKGTEKDKSLITVGKPSKYTKEKIKELNEKGAGIYFTPNRFPTGERKANLCAGVNAWIVENDNLSLEQQQLNIDTCPLIPSFVVKSKNSLHAYWLAKDGTIENYRKIVQGLIKYFNGDTACKDISRVFRIPGFLHQKDRASPKMIELIFAHPEMIYTEEQMLEYFPFVEEKTKPLIIQKFSNTNDFWEMLGSLDNKSVLARLSGQLIINGEIIEFKKRSPDGDYIYVDGKMCDGWIDEQGMIGSGKRGGPTWMQWLGFYGKDKAEIAKWAKENLEEVRRWCLEHEPTKEIITQKQKEIIESIPVKKDYKLRYTWGTRELDTSLAIIKRGNFIVTASKSGSGKTTFVFDMACKNAMLGHKVLFLSLEMNEQDIKEDFGRKYSGITIQEELDYQIPETKQKAFERKIHNINEIKNLKIKSCRRTGDVQWEDIEKMISENGETDLVFIDNLDLIGSKEKESDLERQKRIVKSILNFTDFTKIPIVLIHHYRKSQANGKDMGLDEMSGSGKIRDGADRIIKVIRNFDPEAIYPDKYKTTISLQKGRGYPEATRVIYFIKGTFVDNPPSYDEYSNGQERLENIAQTFQGEIIY